MPRQLDINFEYAGQHFSFQICERDIQFGSAGEGKYYWMDGRQIRRGRGGPNFRPIVDLWWHAVEAAGAADEIDNQVQLVLAECYPLVNTAKALQDIYVDAHLHRTAEREYSFVEEDNLRQRRSDRTFLLAEEECARLSDIAHSHDLVRIRGELEGIFLGELPPSQELPAYQEAARAWIGNGIRALRTDGREGLWQYTETIDEWMRRLRRRGNVNRPRLFLNMFAYESKVAFYSCYCSAWVGILQWLQETQPPNLLGMRFMQMWHHQNRAADDAETHRDAFCGQVLALHPLSAVVLTSPQHLEVLGRWFGHPEFETFLSNDEIANRPEYWDVVTTILVAAHEYDHSRREWEERRDVSTQTNTDTVSEQQCDDDAFSARIMFEDFAASRGLVCEECSGALAYHRHETAESDDSPANIHYRCQECHRDRTIPVTLEDLSS